MLTDEEIAALSDDERADLLRRLVLQPSAARPDVRPTVIPLVLVVTAACLLLIPWTVLLAITLPPDYTAPRWDFTWVGFDTVLIVCLSQTAWYAYRRRQMVAYWAMITATLLICDAWFDVATADGGELWWSLGSAALLELPLAGLLLWWSRRIITLTVRRSRAAIGMGLPDGRVRLTRLPLFGVPPRPARERVDSLRHDGRP